MDNNIMSLAGAAYGQALNRGAVTGKRNRDAEAAREASRPSPEPDAYQESIKRRAMESCSTRVNLEVHDATNHPMIRVTDSETGQLISEVPPEKYLDMVANFLASVDINRGSNLDKLV